MKVQISKDEFYAYGGFSNPSMFRTSHGKKWVYYKYC